MSLMLRNMLISKALPVRFCSKRNGIVAPQRFRTGAGSQRFLSVAFR
jgi:hypothetical protein